MRALLHLIGSTNMSKYEVINVQGIYCLDEQNIFRYEDIEVLVKLIIFRRGMVENSQSVEYGHLDLLTEMVQIMSMISYGNPKMTYLYTLHQI